MVGSRSVCCGVVWSPSRFAIQVNLLLVRGTVRLRDALIAEVEVEALRSSLTCGASDNVGYGYTYG